MLLVDSIVPAEDAFLELEQPSTLEQFPPLVQPRNGSNRDVFNRVDDYFRDSNTTLSGIVTRLCCKRGKEYLNSTAKRVLDLSLAIPAAIVVTPVVCALAVAKKLEDGKTMFFYQERVSSRGQDQNFHIVKIRCMREHSDHGAENVQFARGHLAHEDSRNTKLGAFMRRYQLEELPQIFQVLQRKMSLVGIRPAPQYVFDELKQLWNPRTYQEWEDAYHAGHLGITGLNQVLKLSEKDDPRRNHFDVFYARNASLGLDLYIMWRTLRKLLHTIS